MSARPTKLELSAEDLLQITWDDGMVRQYNVRQLRDSCPCATCREKRQQPQAADLLPVLSAAEVAPLKILGMEPVGHYAYTIRFSDGHDTGIYELGLLRELGEQV
jgi:DUF971 family protein